MNAPAAAMWPGRSLFRMPLAGATQTPLARCRGAPVFMHQTGLRPQKAQRIAGDGVMSDFKHGKMDITEHEKTFGGFIKFSIAIVVISIATLIFMALVNG
jgi:hypothetical protein